MSFAADLCCSAEIFITLNGHELRSCYLRDNVHNRFIRPRHSSNAHMQSPWLQSTALRRVKSARSNTEESRDRTPASQQCSLWQVSTTFTDGHCGRTTAIQQHGITRAELREL